MKKFLIFILVTVILSGFCNITPVFSIDSFNEAVGKLKTASDWTGLTKKNEEQTLEGQVASIINAGLSMIGVIFLVLMIYGGYIWMAARGDEAEAKKAKGIITMAIIGLVVVIAAYAISTFVVGRLIAGATAT